MVDGIVAVARDFFTEHLRQRVNQGKPPDKHRHGGYMCIFSSDQKCDPHAMPLSIVMIGGPPEEKRAKYYELSLEKGRRLLLLSRTAGHKSSWQSRNERALHYGGAIVADGYILSFSGLDELDDEALMLVTGVEDGLMEMDEAHEIARISNNQRFITLSDEVLDFI